jgi:LacI family transcriptional regulator
MIVTAADVIAMGVLSRLQSSGMRIPEDFRVIGFDGIGITRLAHPTLTTVRQPFEEMSQAIRDIIETQLKDSGQPQSIRMKPTLVIGESSPT